MIRNSDFRSTDSSTSVNRTWRQAKVGRAMPPFMAASVGAGKFGNERLPVGLSGRERLGEHSTAIVASQRIVKDGRCWDASVTTDVVARQNASIE